MEDSIMPQPLSNRQEVFKYVIDKLHDIYVAYHQPIKLDTAFEQLESGVDSDLVGAHLFIDIEDEFDIEMTEYEAVALNDGDVRGVIDYIISKLELEKESDKSRKAILIDR